MGCLLLTKRPSLQTRRQLRRNLEDAGDYIKDAADTVSDHAEEYVKRGRSAVEDVVDSASNAVTAAKKVVQI